MQITPFIKEAEIVKAEKKGDRIAVRIIASSEKRDKDGDMFLKSAWQQPQDREFYLKKGYYDYNHLSRLLRASEGDPPEQIAKAELMRARAIIGYPETLEWSDQDGRLISEGFLIPKNEFVKAIAAGLEAGFDRWGASVCGGAFAPSQQTTSLYGQKSWDRARLTHIAICPLIEAKNDETALIMKSIMAEMAPQVQGGLDPAVARMSDFVEKPLHERRFRRLLGILKPYKREMYDAIIEDTLEALASGELDKNEESIADFLSDFELAENDRKSAAKLILVRFCQ